MTIVTRFAPSPTGYLHIGGARTALFNWLYAKHTGGKFLLRIEDTDKERSTELATNAILSGLRWLGLNWDDTEVYQSKNIKRHQEVVQQLLDSGNAYYCYSSKEELDDMRKISEEVKNTKRIVSKWRDCKSLVPSSDVKPVVRLKAPIDGETVIEDMIRGKIVVKNIDLDDTILLRSDGTPTYMLAVVVDDHDMGVTDIIRGDDHLTNASRQKLIYDAMGWETPRFAHIPLIYGSDGTKLSKRHGALGVDAYRDMGYIPEAMRNYLLRLGWSHGNDEVISTSQAIEWFNIENLGKSPSKFDFNKLDNLNSHYLRELENNYLVSIIVPIIQQKLGKDISNNEQSRILNGMNGLKQRAKLITELADSAIFYVKDEVTDFTEKALENLNKEIIIVASLELKQINVWNHDNIESVLRKISIEKNMKLNNLIAPLRAAITGSHISPSMFEVMEILGMEETLKRLSLVAENGTIRY